MHVETTTGGGKKIKAERCNLNDCPAESPLPPSSTAHVSYIDGRVRTDSKTTMHTRPGKPSPAMPEEPQCKERSENTRGRRMTGAGSERRKKRYRCMKYAKTDDEKRVLGGGWGGGRYRCIDARVMKRKQKEIYSGEKPMEESMRQG